MEMSVVDPFTRRNMLAALAAGALASSFAARAVAAYPSRPVRLLVGASPGGPADFLARTLSDAAGPVLGQPMIIDNKPGASGTLAADALAKAPADGYTLLVSGATAITVAPHLYAKLSYDPAGFVPVAMLGAGAFALVVHPSVPAHTVQELLALARAKPGSLAFGSGGNGSSGHLCTELFCSVTGIRMFHVPYKGDAPAVNDLLAGHLQLMFTSPNVALPQVKAGKLRLLAMTTRERWDALPDVPTVSESGVRDFESLGWVAAFAPAGTPRTMTDAVVAAWNKSRAAPEVSHRLDELAMRAPDRLIAGEPLVQFIKAESARLGKLIRDLGIKID